MSTLVAQNVGNGSVSTSMANVVNGSAKAWCYFDGTLSTPTPTGHNVSSITKNGAGDYTLNFTNALPGSVPAYGFSTNSNDRCLVYVSSSTTTLRVQNKNSGAGNYDQSYISICVFR